MSDLSDRLVVRTATIDDADAIFELVNEAYQVETGSDGVAFKNTPRFITVEDEVIPLIKPGTFIVAVLDGSVVGCIYYCESPYPENGEKFLKFGPFAVHPRTQGMGIGNLLMQKVFDKAHEVGALGVDVEVVNWRSDMMRLYGDKMGFVWVKDLEFKDTDRLTRPSYFHILRKTF